MSASQASAVKTVTSDCRRHHHLLRQRGLGMRNTQIARAAWLRDLDGRGKKESAADSKTLLAASHELKVISRSRRSGGILDKRMFVGAGAWNGDSC